MVGYNIILHALFPYFPTPPAPAPGCDTPSSLPPAPSLSPGCDKNMPGTLIAMARLNRPSLMVYGGTIKPGYSALPGSSTTLDIVSAFQSYGEGCRRGLPLGGGGRRGGAAGGGRTLKR